MKGHSTGVRPLPLSGRPRRVVPVGASHDDSAAATTAYVENWIRQQTVLNLAEEHLDDEQKEVEQKLRIIDVRCSFMPTKRN